ncbi:hypothetical protein OEA41_009716 [Lepraria neglecta]|uniref:Uncharacterized protein n=1 Tax=Lepraria neglecta TaxID=209136 RepID=A0AAD9Z2I4_9LECA|nr:hypothetical protein OEA41_009716 [Lepraria neglecta]
MYEARRLASRDKRDRRREQQELESQSLHRKIKAHTGKTEDAINCMEEDLAADPGDATVFNRLTKLRRQLGHENLLKDREQKLEVRRKLERMHRQKHQDG